jgi:hypothetical protein
VGNKLQVVKLSGKAWLSFNSSIQTEEVTVMWLHIGHIHLMYCHLSRGDLTPVCNQCGTLVILHITYYYLEHYGLIHVLVY